MMNKLNQQSVTPETENCDKPDMHPANQQRRRYKRINCRLPLTLIARPNRFWQSASQGFLHSHSINISEGGLLVQSVALSESLKVNDHLRIMIEGIITDKGLPEDSPGDHFDVCIIAITASGIGLKFI